MMGLPPWVAWIEGGQVLQVVQALRADATLPQAFTSENDQPLHIASWQKQLALVAMLLAHGAPLDGRGALERTPLHYAVHGGGWASVPVVAALLVAGANPDLHDVNDYSVADWARTEMVDGLAEVLELIQRSATGPSAPPAPAPPTEPWMRWIREGNLPALSAALRDPSLVHQRDEDGHSPLELACQVKQLPLVATLLGFGAPPNSRGVDGRTPLHWAVHEGRWISVPIVALLRAAGADPWVADDAGMGVGTWASLQMADGLGDVVELLLRPPL